MKTANDVYVDINQSDKMAAWLSHPGSFMQRLKQFGVKNAQIGILKEGWAMPVMDERILLNLSFREFAWVREVSIHSQDTVWMFARTVIPRQTLTGKERALQHLKTRSLGSILFADAAVQRSEFDFFSVNPDSDWYKKMGNYIAMPEEELFARRSTFLIQKKSLLLTEVFFPGIALL